ncbi:RimJ/RimL family protein N-acetyltransferase [Streptacidiphilus sp. MAP12-33]|uniref:GNAT family N-acetyltransferase n=1 Tax=Streptacidiphilus sp. MAP12-33 TaxID=3156266 RepID=UPI003518C9CD
MTTAYAPMPLHLETERLRLRPWAETDAQELLDLHAERGTGRSTLERVREWIAQGQARTAETGFALLRIQLRETGEFVGYCGLIVGRSSAEEPEIAYELLQRTHGHGYATEAARAVVGAATATGRTRLWATVGAWNTPSFRVLEKLDFARHHVTVEEEKGEIVWLTRALP